METGDVETHGARLLAAAAALSDAALLARVNDLSRTSRAVTVELLAHLGELERRGLHRGEGCGRLYSYCIEVLKLSESAAINRIRAARAARRFPVILEMLADGRLNLTSVKLLAPHLTDANHRALLDEARGMTRRQVDEVVARLAPRPDMPASISALAPERYALAVTLDQEGHDDLRWLHDALRREVPDGDASILVRRALRAYRREVARKLFSATGRPRASRGLKPGSRDVSAAVQRVVWARDGGQCAFVARNGRRCSERSYLEFHHVEPYGIGGEPTAVNVSLRCRAHNQYEAELAFGPGAGLRRRDDARAAKGVPSGSRLLEGSREMSPEGRRGETPGRQSRTGPERVSATGPGTSSPREPDARRAPGP